MNKYLFIIFVAIVLFPACKQKEPVIITNIINSCQSPTPPEYEFFNDQDKNRQIEILMNEWPEELRDYLKNKMQNRIIQNARCNSKIAEWQSYEKCILSLYKVEKDDQNNK